MSDRSDAAAVVITGAYGAGKTSLVEEIADILEGRGLRYGAIDLDWLGWFDPGYGDHDAGRPVMLRNVDAVVGNYYDTGVRLFALAGAMSSSDEVDELTGTKASRRALRSRRTSTGFDGPWAATAGSPRTLSPI